MPYHITATVNTKEGHEYDHTIPEMVSLDAAMQYVLGFNPDLTSVVMVIVVKPD